MRTNGIPERLCSGDAPDREKYDAWAATVPRLLRNPLYHWTHLELRRPFESPEPSSVRIPPEISGKRPPPCSVRLHGALDILKKMNVEAVCTTDDPCDDLAAHRRHAASGDSVKLLPHLQAGQARAIHQGRAWMEWVDRLERASGMEIRDLAAFQKPLPPGTPGLRGTAASCRTTPWKRSTMKACPKRRPPHSLPPPGRAGKWRTGCRQVFQLPDGFSCRTWRGLVRQLHVGALQPQRGRPAGSGGRTRALTPLRTSRTLLLWAVCWTAPAQKGTLPSTILYNLNQRDNAAMAVLCGSFQDGVTAGKCSTAPPGGSWTRWTA